MIEGKRCIAKLPNSSSSTANTKGGGDGGKGGGIPPSRFAVQANCLPPNVILANPPNEPACAPSKVQQKYSLCHRTKGHVFHTSQPWPLDMTCWNTFISCSHQADFTLVLVHEIESASVNYPGARTTKEVLHWQMTRSGPSRSQTPTKYRPMRLGMREKRVKKARSVIITRKRIIHCSVRLELSHWEGKRVVERPWLFQRSSVPRATSPRQTKLYTLFLSRNELDQSWNRHQTGRFGAQKKDLRQSHFFASCNQTILPIDFNWKGQFGVDASWIPFAIPLSSRCHLTALLDCCNNWRRHEFWFSFGRSFGSVQRGLCLTFLCYFAEDAQTGFMWTWNVRIFLCQNKSKCFSPNNKSKEKTLVVFFLCWLVDIWIFSVLFCCVKSFLGAEIFSQMTFANCRILFPISFNKQIAIKVKEMALKNKRKKERNKTTQTNGSQNNLNISSPSTKLTISSYWQKFNKVNKTNKCKKHEEMKFVRLTAAEFWQINMFGFENPQQSWLK